MSGELFIYDPTEVSLIVCGIIIDSGFADGHMVKITKTSPRFKTVTGVDGQKSRSKTNDHGATVTIYLMSTSPHNAELSALAALDDAAPNGAGVGPFLCRDKQGTSMHAAPKCWVAEDPEVTYDATATERAWVIEVADLSNFIGGN